MKESAISENPVLVVKAPWFVKILVASVGIPLALWILFNTTASYDDPVIRWFCLLFAGVVIPYVVLFMFLTKTVLTDDSIIHVTRLFRWKRILYKDIEFLKIVGNGDVRLALTDGTSIQILCGTDQQSKVINKIRANVLPHLENEAQKITN